MNAPWCAGACARDPRARFSNALELASAFAEELLPGSEAVGPGAGLRASRMILRKVCRSRPQGGMASGLASGVAGGAGMGHSHVRQAHELTFDFARLGA